MRNVLGGNASFRRSAFDAAGGFATGIGRDGDKRPLGCEETELCIRLSRALPDAVLLIDDRAVIHHRVPDGREHFGYFRTRAYAEGLSKALVARSVGRGQGTRVRAPVHDPGAARPGSLRGLRDALLAPAGRRGPGGRDRRRGGGGGGRLRGGERAGAPGRRHVLGGRGSRRTGPSERRAEVRP